MPKDKHPERAGFDFFPKKKILIKKRDRTGVTKAPTLLDFPQERIAKSIPDFLKQRKKKK